MASSIHIILASGLKGATELTLNVLTSGVLEGLFPPFNPDKSPWMNLFEGTVEIALYLLIAGSASTAFEEMFGDFPLARLPYGSLLMFWLLEGAIAKIMHFVNYVAAKMNIRRVPAKKLVIDVSSGGDTVSQDSMASTSTCSTSSCNQ